MPLRVLCGPNTHRNSVAPEGKMLIYFDQDLMCEGYIGTWHPSLSARVSCKSEFQDIICNRGTWC